MLPSTHSGGVGVQAARPQHAAFTLGEDNGGDLGELLAGQGVGEGPG
ncbi:hypothetical protein MSS93_16545 [Deinococcus radiodurans]|nr:hypothetical protein MSS93_16545 [Deinococcus radiodurans]